MTGPPKGSARHSANISLAKAGSTGAASIARAAAFDDSNRLRDITMEEVLVQAENGAWGTPKMIADKIIAEAEKLGAGTVLVSMNRGAVPQRMFLNQIHRFGSEVLPILQRHKINRVPLAAAAA